MLKILHVCFNASSYEIAKRRLNVLKIGNL